MSLEQTYLQIHHIGTVERVVCLWNRCISRYITLERLLDPGVVSLVPADTGHRALTVPATDAAIPVGRRRCRFIVGVHQVDRERNWSFSRFWHRRRGAETTAPEESSEGQWPGFGLRWSVDVHRLLAAAQQWCGGYHPSQSVVTAPGRRHRHHRHSRGLGRGPGIPPAIPPSG